MSTETNDLTEAQTKAKYNNLSHDEKKKQTYTEWLKENYNYQYERWMPWIEDQYLKWFGNGDNKASYVAKDTLNKTKITGIKQVDQIQDDVHNLIGNQLGENGLLAPLGNLASKEGINRAERRGMDDKGTYGGPIASYSDPVLRNVQDYGEGISSGTQKSVSTVMDNAQGAGGFLGGFIGGGKKD